MDIVSILISLGQWIVSFYYSPFFAVIKFLLGIYAVVLLADIVLMLIQRGLGGDIRDTLVGMNVPAELTTKRNRLAKRWSKISEKMKSDSESAWKVAIIEADNIIDDLIKRMRYPGENMSERLAGINPGQVENIEELRHAHEVRNRIIHEDDLKLTRELADETMAAYENFLKYFEVLE
ncbi:MAG: hypothetical protein P4L62_01620 [Candidatus Pacebacteria bacterium]|nr:hypothetical protein [Candidatus Paceibacterota bacterium]